MTQLFGIRILLKWHWINNSNKSEVLTTHHHQQQDSIVEKCFSTTAEEHTYSPPSQPQKWNFINAAIQNRERCRQQWREDTSSSEEEEEEEEEYQEEQNRFNSTRHIQQGLVVPEYQQDSNKTVKYFCQQQQFESNLYDKTPHTRNFDENQILPASNDLGWIEGGNTFCLF